MQLSINSSIDWRQVLPILGIDAAERPMPMLSECPLCHGHRLRIFDDTRFGGNWHHCLDCNSTGDMIALAAKAWDLDVPATIRKLADSGATIKEGQTYATAIRRYMWYFSDMQYQAGRLIKDARDELYAGHANVSYVLQQSGFPGDQLSPYWPKRMGRFMGGATRLRVYQAIYNQPHTTDYNVMKAGQRILSGRGWRDVVTIPFHSLPGQVAGWLFIGRRGKSHTDHAFHIVDAEQQGATSEVGVCMYDVLDAPTSHADKFGDDVFVFNDPLHALKLQSRHMRDSALPLPLVSTYNARVKRKKNTVELVCHDVWRSRPDKKFIFWGPVVSADLFNMASRANGHLFISKGPQHMKRQLPHAWLSHIKKHARHWMVTLDSHLKVMPEEVAITFLNTLRIAQDQMHQFRDNCSPAVYKLLDSNKGRVHLLSTARVNGKDIVESERGWSVHGKLDECISNAIIRIEKVLCSTDAEIEPIYVGRILFDGEEYEFQEPMDKLEKNPGPWLKKKLLAEAGKLAVVRAGWNPHLLDIARHFHEPEIIREDGRFGWKPHESCFAFPKFSVHLGGEVNAEPAHVVDEWAPGLELTNPNEAPDLKALLADTPSNRLYWAATTCIAANVLAPAVGQRPAGLGLIGHGGLMIGRASARAAGCHEYSPGGHTSIQGERAASTTERILQRHNWPLILNISGTGGSNKAILNTWLNGDYSRNAIVYMPTELHAATAATLGPWRFIRESQPIEAGPEVRMYGRYVLPVWLKWICRKRLDVSGDTDYLQCVNQMLVEVMQNYGDPAVVVEGGLLIDPGSECDTQRASCMAKMLWTLIDSGSLKFVHASDADTVKVPKLILISGDGYAPSVFVGRDTLNSLLSKRGITLPDHAKVTEALRIGNALDRECEYNGEIGWLIVETWWSKQIDRFRSSQRLSVIGGKR